MGVELLTHGREYGLVQVRDVLVEPVDGVVALVLPGALVLDGQDQRLHGIRHGLRVRGQELPGRRVVGVDGQALGGGEETVAGAVDVLAGHDDGFLGLSSLGADLGRGGGKLGAGGEGGEGLNGFHQGLGGFGTGLTVGLREVAS